MHRVKWWKFKDAVRSAGFVPNGAYAKLVELTYEKLAKEVANLFPAETEG